MSRKRCICSFKTCREYGGGATIRLPKDDHDRSVWLHYLRPEGDSECLLQDPRVSLTHFPQEDVVARKVGSSGSVSSVGVREGSRPILTEEDMAAAHQRSLLESVSSRAAVRSLEEAVAESARVIAKLKAKVKGYSAENAALKEERAKTAAKGGVEAAPVKGMDHTILIGKKEDAVRVMVGLPRHSALVDLYDALNDKGAADNIVFYGDAPSVKSDGSRAEQRQKTFRGINGLFFLLYVLRTGTSIALASSHCGVDATTGGRAFTTWLNFVSKALQPVVRLPLPEEVAATAPPNFVRSRLSNVITVLDATEVGVRRVWHKNIAHTLYSKYKNKPTGKVLIGITPGGAICYISPVYGGRLSDAEVVRESGLIQKLVRGGFAHGKFEVMTDRGFNSISPLLLSEGISFVAPPWKRRGEEQFTEADVMLTHEVSNLRIHVERAIGALKTWRMLDSTFSAKQMDLIGMCFNVCGALVNLLNPPFASRY